MPADGRRHDSGARLTKRRLALSAISLPTRGGDPTATGQMPRVSPQSARGHTPEGESSFPKGNFPSRRGIFLPEGESSSLKGAKTVTPPTSGSPVATLPLATGQK